MHVNDPFLCGLLWQSKKIPPKSILTALRSREYGAVLTAAELIGDKNPASPAVLAILRCHVKLEDRITMGDRALHVPVQKPPEAQR